MHARAQRILLSVLLCSAGCGTEPVVVKSTELLAGGQQTGALGAPLAESLSVRVVGSDGKPFRGAPVSWSVVAGGGTVSPATSTTSPDGIARTLWTLGTRLDEAHVARATAAGLSPVTFTATPSLPASAVIEKTAGDAQHQTVDNVLTDSLVATVKLADGRPVQGATVSWATGANAGSVSPASAVSRSDGVAKTSWRLGTRAGPVASTASVSGLAAATFSATGKPGPVDVVSIDGKTKVLVGSGVRLTALVADRFGNVVTDPTVAWTSDSEQVASVSASGVVTGARPGRTTIVATVDGKSGSGLVAVIAPLGFGTPTIDGVLGGGEWAHAASFSIDVVLPEGGTTPGTVYMMNDASNLYLALRYQRSVNDPASGVQFQFDNNGNGVFDFTTTEEGDDQIALNAGQFTTDSFMDAYWTYRPPCPAGSLCGLFDSDDGGAVNGSGAHTHDGTFHTFEVAHPLRSGDPAHDISLNPGQDVGMRVEIRIIATGADYPRGFGDTSWPYVYMRVGSAP